MVKTEDRQRGLNHGTEVILKTVIHENFSDIKKDLNLQIERAYQVPGKLSWDDQF